MPRAVAMADSRDSAGEEEGDSGEAGTEEAREGECVGAPVEQPAPTEPPPHLLDAYTLNHTVPIERLYIDEANGGQGTHYRYSRAEVQAYVDAARAELSGPSRFRGPSRGGRAAEGRRWLMNALSRLPVLGMSAAVFGAIEPWAEALLLASGAASVTTYEHNKLTYDHPALFTASVQGLAADHARGRRLGAHQLALSLSAFDHDGLGRYGDPLDPRGDLSAMATAWRSLAPGGYLLLTVPVGPDCLVWNALRRYGPLRLPLLLSGWEEVERVGWEAEKLTEPADARVSYEPLFVLRRNGTATGDRLWQAREEPPEPVGSSGSGGDGRAGGGDGLWVGLASGESVPAAQSVSGGAEAQPIMRGEAP